MTSIILQQVKLISRIKNAYSKFESESDNVCVSSCRVRMETLKNNWVKFETQDALLYDHPDYSKLAAEQPYFKDGLFDDTESVYLKNLGLFQLYLDSHPHISLNSTAIDNNLLNFRNTNNEDSERLPRINLPEFSGEYKDWESFRDVFQSSVIDKHNVPDVTKLRHLRTCLKGDAEDLVKSYPITSENFPIIWKKLVDKYENKKRLVNSHMSSIFSIKPMAKSSSAELKRVLVSLNTPLSALKVLKRPVDKWDDWLVFHAVSLLDNEMKKQWENFFNNLSLTSQTVNNAATLVKGSDPPTFEQLISFVESQISILESLEENNNTLNLNEKPITSNNNNSFKNLNVNTNPARVFHTQVESSKQQCPLCKGEHLLFTCNEYKKMAVEKRYDCIKQLKSCTNCLGNHSFFRCPSKKRCNVCKGKHHTTLHNEKLVKSKAKDSKTNSGSTNKNKESNPSAEQTASTTNLCTFSVDLCKNPCEVLLSSAIVKVVNEDGFEFLTRALLDNCSQASFISESLFRRLKLKFMPLKMPILGIGGVKNYTCRKLVKLHIKPHFVSDFSIEVLAFVISRVSSYSPTASKRCKELDHISGLLLADPNFHKRGQIEILLSASVHASIVEEKIKRGAPNDPIAISTKLGWVISGNAGIGSASNLSVISDAESTLSFDLERFWRQEEIFDEPSKLLSPDEQECEDHFFRTYSRNSEGRYMVRLPFKRDPENLKFPGSFSIAERMLLRMEKRFLADTILKNLYSEFMKDYEDTGHMGKTDHIFNFILYYFLPHHGILKKNSLKPKLRTVFNGSANDYDGISLNSLLHTGPNLLPDLAELLIHWMKYQYVFVSDIKQMYRQILIHPEDRKYQQILWRENSNDKIQAYSLNTVTYGVVSSPYHAIRVTKQLAIDEGEKYPLGAEVLNSETYMDDTLSGGYSLPEALKKQQQLIDICKCAGFELHKWMSNNDALLNFPKDIKAGVNASNSYFSLLGLNWNPKEDYFTFNIQLDQFEKDITKRDVLSSISKLFDPLGYLSPVLITGKAFMQKLWIKKVKWDDKLMISLSNEFLSWYKGLIAVNLIRIPRWLGFVPDAKYEIFGFCDASQMAYAACVYLKTTVQNRTEIRLLQAKSKVSPIKPMLSIPKLELCSALLLARLTVKLQRALDLPSSEIFLFIDSQDVLFWLREHPSKWSSVFVRNRCSKIHNKVPEAFWSHVRTHENPADCASRGISPEQLQNFSLWWEGNDRMKKNINFASDKNAFQSKSINLVTAHVVHIEKVKHDKIWDLVSKYSDLLRLLKITALVFRFLSKLLIKIKSKNINKFEKIILKLPIFQFSWFNFSESNNNKFVSVFEMKRAKLFWVYITQLAHFKNEMITLNNGSNLIKSSDILKLDPFLEDNLLRVGGRIQNSLLNHEQKHSLIVPKDCAFLKLLIRYYHQKTLHGGVTLTLATLRQEFWLINGRNLVRSYIFKCHECIRYKANLNSQKMGILPPSRVQRPEKPFINTGIDYAGPYKILRYRGRGSATYKAYIGIFVCMATKAVHLELITGYSSDDFIAAFRRFTSTRGPCTGLFSDQGTTFIGADKALKELYMASSSHMQELQAQLTCEGTTWSFNPPGAPHFGGLWEAAVKSVKYHLRRVLGDHTLTFEEFYTLLKQIEACLNSRPLLPLSDIPTDGQFLSPSFLLTQSNSFIVPEPSYLGTNIPPMERYKQIQKLLQEWWESWSREYLQSLQERQKWRQNKRNLLIDDIVLVSNETLPPSKWPLGRVIKIYQGSDELTRAVEIKTASSILKRPVHKLVLLQKSDSANI